MAYYSKLQRATYHIYSNCSVGNNMVKGHLRRGKPKPIKGRGGITKKPRLCRTCARLRAKGTGKLGIPILPEPYRGDIVETYYSKASPETFHMCQNCFLGQNIEKANLVANKPPRVKNAKLCKICAKLCIEGKCITGTPIPADKIKSPYYSKAHTPPRVFHACKNCYIGKRIKNRAKGGPDEARLCRVCYRLLRKDKCILSKVSKARRSAPKLAKTGK
jgi:hypothetical protein